MRDFRFPDGSLKVNCWHEHARKFDRFWHYSDPFGVALIRANSVCYGGPLDV